MNAFDRIISILDHFRPVANGKVRPHLEPEEREPGARQAAALVLRERKGRREVLLITSRDTGRWIVPKGWIEEDEDGAAAAEREAWEEAGVLGTTIGPALGSYDYLKIRPQRGDVLCTVDIHLLRLEEERGRWPEYKQRKRKWVRLPQALDIIEEPGLVDALRTTHLFSEAA
ncbi:MAG: NUDIX hydrolase [Rhizobiales bacterium]|nr:NUDIX hydrolase [Hyphomicrobiales bacterium]MBA70884.1 NUDIX hydrolase [Hyphomicrobiales bacterium]|tara:strand:+ start:941 stop:1456 length:516 start_codon:yes stop_codon:yes gene_type:complete